MSQLSSPARMAAPVPLEPVSPDAALAQHRTWFTRFLERTPSWLASLLIHMLALITAALIFGGKIIVERIVESRVIITVPPEPLEQPELARVTLTKLQYEQPPELAPTEPVGEEPGNFGKVEGTVDLPLGEPVPGGGMPNIPDFPIGPRGLSIPGADGPMLRGEAGPLTGHGQSNTFGSGGDKFGWRGDPNARMKPGNTKQNDLAVVAALSWLARHQAADGRWSLAHRGRCRDASCTGEGSSKSDTAATALAIIPFEAAGITHQRDPLDVKHTSPYPRVVQGGISFLLKNQKSNGDYSGEGYLYAHGLATIALSEAYGMTHDSRLRDSVLAAVRYLEAGQDPDTGGWWYNHMQRGGDSSVVGWQVMGLKSAQMAGVPVQPATLRGAEKWFTLVGKGQYHGQFSYRPDSPASPNMTAVGLLCTQYLGAPRGDVRLQEGTRQLMQNLPSAERTNFYYWYYGSQVMHNMQGPEWDTWNRAMRRTLVDLQDKTGCAAGSWDPAKEPFGKQGGRLFVTSLATLTLEVYYRYMPLYQLDGRDELKVLPK